MAKYYANIVLLVNEFEAEDNLDASNVLNKYIDLLAETKGDLNWEEVDWKLMQDNGDVVIPFYGEVYN